MYWEQTKDLMFANYQLKFILCDIRCLQVGIAGGLKTKFSVLSVHTVSDPINSEELLCI